MQKVEAVYGKTTWQKSSRRAAMIESMMLFAIGALASALMGLLLVPVVHRRAVRVTTVRLDQSIPPSVAELRAEKDHLRAEFAMSIRRLENTVEQLKTKTATYLADIGKKKERINLLQTECRGKDVIICSLKDEKKAMLAQLRVLEGRAETGSSELLAARHALLAKETECGNLLVQIAEKTKTLSEHKVRIQRIQNEIDTSGGMVQSLRAELAAAQIRQRSVADIHHEIDRLEAQMEAVIAASANGAEYQ